MISLVIVAVLSGVSGIPCYFNPMCSCKLVTPSKEKNSTVIRDISCAGVPFSRLPDFPGSKTSHIDVVSSGLEVVEADAIASRDALSIRFISNSISLVSEKAFTSSAKTLRSLDLSYNRLEKVPFSAIAPLTSLEWLNLHSNSLSSIQGDWSGVASTLTNLYLGENQLETFEGLKTELKTLTLLNLDKNQIKSVEPPDSIPPSLQTLSLSGNNLMKFPWESLSFLDRISWLYLRDNFINKLPLYNFKHRKKLDKLELGENFLREIQTVFNGSLQVRDLNLDLNDIIKIDNFAFKGTDAGRVCLSQNRLAVLSEKVFSGVEHSLEYLDLGGNLFRDVPKAVNILNKLKYFYIPSNNISSVSNGSFEAFASTLSALSLSGNRLVSIPSHALTECTRLTHLNLGYNHIMDFREEDLNGLESLDTLLLMNNRIVELHEHTFRQTPNLRELSLSFNKISAIEVNAFVDVSDSLESLEISFGIYEENFPEEHFKSLKSLVWLALDNNNFRSMSKTSLYTFNHLQYLNLEGNKLSELPVGTFHQSIHSELRNVRLSYNHLMSVDPHSFTNLIQLESVDLCGNQIRIVKTNAFRSLPSKLSILLSDNKIHTVSPRSFNDISTLARLDLQSNELKYFSLSAFHNVTAPYLPMALNLSRNQIEVLRVAETPRQVCVHTLDVSHNKLLFVPKDFLSSVSGSLLKVMLSFNRISKLDEAAFGELPALQMLNLEHNLIVSLRKRAFIGLGNLQILDLSHNHIEQLHMEQFRTLPNLRIINLSYNHIRSIPRDSFQHTKIERLDISNNEFLVMPSSALGEIGFTLRILDASYNQIDRLDTTVFPETPLLATLNLCHNKLTVLPDGVFKSLANLDRLELCSNRIRANYHELLQFSDNLQQLNLGDTGIRNLPALPPLPNLVTFNLSANPLASISSLNNPSLRVLLVSRCHLPALPSWIKLPLLKHLDISFNPIKILSKESFRGLNRLESLDLTGLDDLERVDLDSFSYLTSLRSLKLQTWPELIAGGVGHLVRRIRTLRRLTVTVTESHLVTLGAPLSAKLRHLEITGSSLKSISPGALKGLASAPELVLQIRGTSVEELPLGLFAPLRITHLSIDLRNNRLVSLSPDILYYNPNSWENSGTKLISGGLMLGGNRWICDCGLVWVGHWLRRWLRESLELHATGMDPAVLAVVREAVCIDPKTQTFRPLIDLHPETLSCHASALSRGGGVPLAALETLIVSLACFPLFFM